jgi:hypothetical protein
MFASANPVSLSQRGSGFRFWAASGNAYKLQERKEVKIFAFLVTEKGRPHGKQLYTQMQAGER